METYAVIRSRRRTVALEITKDCRVLVRAPTGMPAGQIAAFVDVHEAWIAAHLARQRSRMEAAPPPPSPQELAAMREKMRQLIIPKVAFYSERMGLVPTGVTITAARTRYGSCSGKNRLSFSCFLANSPDAAIDLVVVHELCHIAVKNHGPDFYALLSSVLPDYKERKKLLR